MSERFPEQIDEQIRELLDSLYRVDSGRILATLIRLLGDFDLAEEAMHEAFAAALSLWPRSGVPGNPRPWLISTARFKAIDTLRRRARFDASQDELARYLEAQLSAAENSNEEEDSVDDDRLRLIFTCCHPALPPESRVALTLREVCGLTTEEIAKAFLTTPRTLAQRIVRAKAKIRETPIPYEVPSPQELPERLGAVLQVIYLVFNEGYSAAAGTEVTRAELTGEAIRLGRLLIELQPEPEVIGLLSLMLLQESRHAARTSPTGELILLENQDRSLWNREQIAEGSGVAGQSPEVPPLRFLHTTGCDCGRSCGGGVGGCNRLAADCCALRRIATNSTFASCAAKSCRGNCNVRWSRGRSDAYRSGVGEWRIGKLLPGAFSPCRYVPQAGPDR
jgi:RNA polymerase sigma-70 factor, ECF subfamily